MTETFTPDRRTLMKLAAGASAASLPSLAGCAVLGVTPEPSSGARDTAFALGARTSGWRGLAPEQIRGDRNPTLRLVPETTVELTWENLDGEPHALHIEDSLGHTLVASTESSERGATRTVSFEASERMTTYLDPRYPVYMRGELLVTTY